MPPFPPAWKPLVQVVFAACNFPQGTTKPHLSLDLHQQVHTVAAVNNRLLN